MIWDILLFLLCFLLEVGIVNPFRPLVNATLRPFLVGKGWYLMFDAYIAIMNCTYWLKLCFSENVNNIIVTTQHKSNMKLIKLGRLTWIWALEFVFQLLNRQVVNTLLSTLKLPFCLNFVAIMFYLYIARLVHGLISGNVLRISYIHLPLPCVPTYFRDKIFLHVNI